MNYDYEKYQAMLRMEQLMNKLVEQQQQERMCHRCVMLNAPPLTPLPVAVPEPPPDETTYNRYGASLYLEKSESSVTRWRKAGKLKYVMEGKQIRYPESVLDAFYLKIWCFQKKKKHDDKKNDKKA